MKRCRFERDCIRHPMVQRWISGLSGRPTGDCACGAEEGDLCRRKIAFWHYPRYSDFETYDDAGACTDMLGYYAARDGWWVRMLMLAA